MCLRARPGKFQGRSYRREACANGLETANMPDGGNALLVPMGDGALFARNRQVNSITHDGYVTGKATFVILPRQTTKKAGAILHRPSSYRSYHQCQYIRGQKSKATKTTANDIFCAHQQLLCEVYRCAIWPKQVCLLKSCFIRHDPFQSRIAVCEFVPRRGAVTSGQPGPCPTSSCRPQSWSLRT
jgi:hypothetical protein